MMNYKTVSEAVDSLKKRGYTIDFNIGFDGVQSHRSAFSLVPDKFLITEVYRFEGETSPDDEAVVMRLNQRTDTKESW